MRQLVLVYVILRLALLMEDTLVSQRAMVAVIVEASIENDSLSTDLTAPVSNIIGRWNNIVTCHTSDKKKSEKWLHTRSRSSRSGDDGYNGSFHVGCTVCEVRCGLVSLNVVEYLTESRCDAQPP